MEDESNEIVGEGGEGGEEVKENEDRDTLEVELVVEHAGGGVDGYDVPEGLSEFDEAILAGVGVPLKSTRYGVILNTNNNFLVGVFAY